jgi:UDP-N-acetylglucosamine acyltransferase
MIAQMINQNAIVDAGANLAPDVEVGPFAIVEAGATVGAGCVLAAHAVVRAGAVLEEGVRVDSFAVLGGPPQDLSFDLAVPSGVRIGRGTVVREHVTVHRSTQPGGFTTVGAQCFLMSACHVGHDCTVGDRVVIANSVLLAGHVQVGDHAFFGGDSAVHQYTRVGRGAMVGGGARMALDTPPFCMVTERNRLVGLNLVGLKRLLVQRPAIAELKDCFRAVFGVPGNRRRLAAARLAQGVEHEPAHTFLQFFEAGNRGFAIPGDGDE